MIIKRNSRFAALPWPLDEKVFRERLLDDSRSSFIFVYLMVTSLSVSFASATTVGRKFYAVFAQGIVHQLHGSMYQLHLEGFEAST